MATGDPVVMTSLTLFTFLSSPTGVLLIQVYGGIISFWGFKFLVFLKVFFKKINRKVEREQPLGYVI